MHKAAICGCVSVIISLAALMVGLFPTNEFSFTHSLLMLVASAVFMVGGVVLCELDEMRRELSKGISRKNG